ncbi:hypothetical protein R1flu_002054 [Riccia fluitans]|uniref:CWF21 domain-containing protein n=1 Tax=Riccia fluitans TaxID=41844 RepID=A0ABD1Y618_9MARC
MYNGIGLQTPRGSGTNGYIQTNKFFVKARPLKSEPREFQNGQGQGGVSRKANKDILEHDRKRQIELKLTQLEDDLLEQGFFLEAVAGRVESTRKVLESFSSENDTSTSTKVPETQSHQIAAKKEKQLDVMKAALGIEEIKEGEAFDRELQEQRKQERILAREEK